MVQRVGLPARLILHTLGPQSTREKKIEAVAIPQCEAGEHCSISTFAIEAGLKMMTEWPWDIPLMSIPLALWVDRMRKLVSYHETLSNKSLSAFSLTFCKGRQACICTLVSFRLHFNLRSREPDRVSSLCSPLPSNHQQVD